MSQKCKGRFEAAAESEVMTWSSVVWTLGGDTILYGDSAPENDNCPVQRQIWMSTSGTTATTGPMKAIVVNKHEWINFICKEHPFCGMSECRVCQQQKHADRAMTSYEKELFNLFMKAKL